MPSEERHRLLVCGGRREWRAVGDDAVPAAAGGVLRVPRQEGRERRCKMSTTDINLTPEVVETIYSFQKQGNAEGWVSVLQKVLEGIIRDDMGDDGQRLQLAGEVLSLQDELRTFILPEGGDA